LNQDKMMKDLRRGVSRGFKDEAMGLVIGALPPQFQAYGEIAVMRSDGSDLRVLTDDSIEQGTPVWTPAGRARPF
jgi:hypothetical protein